MEIHLFTNSTKPQIVLHSVLCLLKSVELDQCIRCDMQNNTENGITEAENNAIFIINIPILNKAQPEDT